MTDDYRAVFLIADKFEISRVTAAKWRVRFLKTELALYMAEWARSGCDISFHWAIKTLDEINYLMKNCRKVKTKNSPITDSMIEIAKSVDVKQVIEFKNGVARAWCHQDNKPSLHYASRTRKARCPVCNKMFNAVEVLMQRDGYSFVEAVKALS